MHCRWAPNTVENQVRPIIVKMTEKLRLVRDAYLVSDRCRHTGPSPPPWICYTDYSRRREKSAGPLPLAEAVPGSARTPDPLARYTGTTVWVTVSPIILLGLQFFFLCVRYCKISVRAWDLVKNWQNAWVSRSMRESWQLCYNIFFNSLPTYLAGHPRSIEHQNLNRIQEHIHPMTVFLVEFSERKKIHTYNFLSFASIHFNLT